MSKPINTLTISIAAAFLFMSAALASGGASQKEPATATPQTPEQQAREFYDQGLRLRDKAWKAEAAAAAKDTPEQQAKLRVKAAKQYSKSIKYFELATEKKPDFFQAFGSLGYALRKTGDHTTALTAYDRALEIDPTYTAAIEYRAEAYLGLGRIDEAKQAYMTLFSADRERADELMTAMQAWVTLHREAPGNVSPDSVEQLATWLEQRQELAGQAPTVSRRREWE